MQVQGKLKPNSFDLETSARALLAERRGDARVPVVRSAKLVAGEGFHEGVYNCLVLDESAGGALVDLGAVFLLPEEAELHLAGGAVRRVRRCWTAGSKVGLEFIGEPLVSAEAKREMASIAGLIRERGLPAGLAALRARNFFGMAPLRAAAEAAEAAYGQLTALLVE
jgi:hypothetical protein